MHSIQQTVLSLFCHLIQPPVSMDLNNSQSYPGVNFSNYNPSSYHNPDCTPDRPNVPSPSLNMNNGNFLLSTNVDTNTNTNFDIHTSANASMRADYQTATPNTPLANAQHYPPTNRISTSFTCETGIPNNYYSASDLARTPMSLLSNSAHVSNANPLFDTPYTPISPYNKYPISLDNDVLIPNNPISHHRTLSLPSTLKLSNLSTRSNNTNYPSDYHSSFDINRFSLPAIVDDDCSIDVLNKNLGTLSFDDNPYVSTSTSANCSNTVPSFPSTRRNTMFSNASSSSTGTSNSTVSSNSVSASVLANPMFYEKKEPSTLTPPAPAQAPTFFPVNAQASSPALISLPTGPAPSLSPPPSSTPVSYSNKPLNLTNLDLLKVSPHDILMLSKDQHGCRTLQKLIDDDRNKNFPLIFNSTYKNSSSLMLDPFGNYLIQKLMLSATCSQVSLILIEISPHIEKIAVNLHGTRALQKLIGCLTTSNHHDLIAIAISPVIVKLVHDLNGNHVIQKLISHFYGNDLEFLIDLIITNLNAIAAHKHGCCVLQKLLNKCSDLQVSKISNEILKNSVYLMKDQFGNYVIQYLISLDIDGVNFQLLQLVANDIVSLSCGKFSSNVVEKCLKLNPAGCSRHNNINPLLASMINIETLICLIKDQYGNYVIQTALEISTWPVKCVMAEMIRPVLPNIRYSNYGKRIYSKVITILSSIENKANANASANATAPNNNTNNAKTNNTINNCNSNTHSSVTRELNLLPGINFSGQN